MPLHGDARCVVEMTYSVDTGSGLVSVVAQTTAGTTRDGDGDGDGDERQQQHDGLVQSDFETPVTITTEATEDESGSSDVEDDARVGNETTRPSRLTTAMPVSASDRERERESVCVCKYVHVWMRLAG